MDETKAIARLPQLEIEIWHRRLPEEQAEQLAISLKATPSFEGFASFLEQPGPWVMLQPWLLWGQLAQAVWQPWLAASRVALALAAPRRPTPPDSGPRRSDTNPAKS
jgi:hypothetical protein